MAKRKFALATLLRLRKRAEDQARAELGRRTADALAAEAELQERYRQLTANIDTSHTSPVMFQAAAAARTASRSLYEEAQAFREVKEQDRKMAEGDWLGAHHKTQAMERLEERHNETVKAEELRKEQAEIDDIVNAKYSTDADHSHQED